MQHHVFSRTETAALKKLSPLTVVRVLSEEFDWDYRASREDDDILLMRPPFSEEDYSGQLFELNADSPTYYVGLAYLVKAFAAEMGTSNFEAITMLSEGDPPYSPAFLAWQKKTSSASQISEHYRVCCYTQA